MRLRACKAISFAALAVMSTLAFSPSAAEAATKNQCLVMVTGRAADNTFILSEERCFATYAEVLRSAGGKNVPDSVRADVYTPAALASGVIGTHYDGFGGTGASVSVGGTNCIGGGLNLPASWNDRISSTSNGCPTIVHFENANYAGSTVTTFTGTTDLSGYMNDRTTSIKYFA